MSYGNDITGLVEDAAQFYLRSIRPSAIPRGNIYTGLDDESLLLPRVVCLCQRAEAIIQSDGIWDASLQVIVRSNCDDTPRAAHRRRAGQIFAAFAIGRDAACDALSDYPGFTADDLLMTEQGWDRVTAEKARSWRSWMIFSVKCHGDDGSIIPTIPIRADTTLITADSDRMTADYDQ